MLIRIFLRCASQFLACFAFALLVLCLRIGFEKLESTLFLVFEQADSQPVVKIMMSTSFNTTTTTTKLD